MDKETLKILNNYLEITEQAQQAFTQLHALTKIIIDKVNTLEERLEKLERR